MKKTILLAFIFAASTFTAFSQTKQESIKELMRIMQADSTMEKTFSAIMPSIMSQFPKENMTPEKTAMMNELMSSIMTSTQEICKKIMNEDFVVIYGKYYTEQEIRELIAFYKTPTGQKMIKNMPEIQKEISTVMMQKYLPDLQKNISELVLKMK
jgi:hypothetical protein